VTGILIQEHGSVPTTVMFVYQLQKELKVMLSLPFTRNKKRGENIIDPYEGAARGLTSE
jgi:hypothetical protein